MRLAKSGRILLPGLMALPLLGVNCAEETAVQLVITHSVDHEFHAGGSINSEFGAGTFDVKADLDLPQVLLDNDIDANQISEVTLKSLWYRITSPDAVANRRIENGTLVATWGARPQETVASGFSAGAGSGNSDPGVWVEITDRLQAAGVAEINAFLSRCLDELQTGQPAADTSVSYQWSGNSTPTDQTTDFDWAMRLIINIKPVVIVDVPL